MKEHGGHLAHLNPLHNVKVVHVAPRPLCNAQSRVKRRTGHSPLHQEKHTRTKIYRIFQYHLFKYWILSSSKVFTSILKTATNLWQKERVWCRYRELLNTYEWIRSACSLVPIARGPRRHRLKTPRWSRCPRSLETTWERTSTTWTLISALAALYVQQWRATSGDKKATAVLEFTMVQHPRGAF